MSNKVYVKKVDGLIVPNRANKEDAGYDVVATSDPKIVGDSIKSPGGLILYKSIKYIEYETNLAFAPNDIIRHTVYESDGGSSYIHEEEIRMHTLIFPRSSISKYNLILANSVGLIDQGYRNNVLFRFKYIFQPEDLYVSEQVDLEGKKHLLPYCAVHFDKIYKKGDRIGQLLFETTTDVNFELVDELPDSNRGLGGWGSSGN